jgi:hypothetical protein
MPFFGRQFEHQIANSAKMMHEVFVKERSRNGFNPDRFLIPMPYRNRFADRSYLYCEAVVFYILMRERQFDPKYEELIFEYEILICPPSSTGETPGKIEKFKSAVKDIAKFFKGDMTQLWAWRWFEAIGYKNANPTDLTLLLNAFSTTASGVKESLQKMRAASLL